MVAPTFGEAAGLPEYAPDTMPQAAVVPLDPHSVLLPCQMIVLRKGRLKTLPVIRGYMIPGDTGPYEPPPEFLCGFRIPLSPDIGRYFPGSPVIGAGLKVRDKPAFMGLFPRKCPKLIGFKGIVAGAFGDRGIVFVSDNGVYRRETYPENCANIPNAGASDQHIRGMRARTPWRRP